MKFNKKLLATAVVAALGSSSAYAVFDMSADPAATPVTYASEIAVDTGSAFTMDSAQVNAGRTLGSGAYAVLFVLDQGLEFNAASLATPTLTYSCQTTASGCTSSPQTISGFYASQDTTNPNNLLTGTNQATVFSIPEASGVTATDTFTLNSPVLKLDSAASVDLTYRLYDDVSSAEGFSNNNIFGGTVKKTYLKFSPVLQDGKPGAPSVSTIDVAAGSATLEGTNQIAALCELDVSFDTDPKFDNSGSLTAAATAAGGPTVILSSATDGSQLVVTGDFSAAKDANGELDAEKVFLSTTSLCSTVMTTAPATVADDFQTATFNFNNNAPGGGSSVFVCYQPDQTTPLVEMTGVDGTLTAQYRPGAAPDYNVGNIDATCGGLKKGGSSASIPMILNPTSAYGQFIRVTNPSNTDGKVRITAYNDKGEKGPNVFEFDLPAGNSTGLFTSQTILDKTGVTFLDAVNDNITPANVIPSKANKVRLVVDAEFGSTGTSTGVQVRTYATTQDGNGFSQFQ